MILSGGLRGCIFVLILVPLGRRRLRWRMGGRDIACRSSEGIVVVVVVVVIVVILIITIVVVDASTRRFLRFVVDAETRAPRFVSVFFSFRKNDTS